MATRLLIDSHILIWLLYEPERFDQPTLEAFQMAEVVYVSAVSFWELAVKHASGKLRYRPEDLVKGREELGLQIMPLAPNHTLRLEEIELPHKDPFDRMLLAQAVAEHCTFVTADSSVLATPYDTLRVII